MSVHDGHRKRLKERFLCEGLDSFTDIQALELLLFYCIPRKDTNEVAHALLNKFKTFSNVLDAEPEDLMKVDGIGESAAAFLNLIPAVGRYYSVNQAKNIKILRSVKACGEYLMSFFKNRTNEMVYMLCLDAKCKVLCCKEIGEGSVNSANVPVRRVVQTALEFNASAVVLAHNHPSGLALPSNEDVMTTRQVAAALDAVDITLADHIVVADDDFVSMAQSGYFRPGECTLSLWED